MATIVVLQVVTVMQVVIEVVMTIASQLLPDAWARPLQTSTSPYAIKDVGR
jgi:hypothetical protein